MDSVVEISDRPTKKKIPGNAGDFFVYHNRQRDCFQDFGFMMRENLEKEASNGSCNLLIRKVGREKILKRVTVCQSLE